MNNITISRIDTVEEIVTTLKFCAEFFHNQKYNTPDNVKYLSQKFADYGNVIRATSEDVLLGFCAYYANDFDCYCAYLSMIIVVSAAQGMGVGKELLKSMICDCRTKGMRFIRLEVACDNHQAISFYTKNEFKLEKSVSNTTVQYILEL